MASIRRRTWRTANGEEREAWIADFTDQNGARHQPQFARRKDADAWLVRARAQAAAGTFAPDSTSITVGAAATLWLQRCENEGLEPATLVQYRSHVTHHIDPLLGGQKLSRLTTPTIELFIDKLLTGGRTRILTKKILASLKALISEAQRRGLCAQNVATGVNVKLAKRHERKVEIPSKAEIRALLASATGRSRAFVVTAIFTGMRASELRGLTWDHVDFARKLILVRQRADASGRIGSLKSGSSRRDIPMTPMMMNTLKEWRLQCPGGELVFPGQGGHAIGYTALHDQLGPLHRFRHFFASWLIDQGFGPKRVQVLMGHSSIAITFDVYGHLFPQEDDHDRFAAGELALVG